MEPTKPAFTIETLGRVPIDPAREEALYRMFRSRVPNIDVPLKILTGVGVPRGDLICRVLEVALEHQNLRDAARRLNRGVAQQVREIGRLAASARKWATKVAEMNSMIIAPLPMPADHKEEKDMVLALPAVLNAYADLLTILKQRWARRTRGKSQPHQREQSLCLWIRRGLGPKWRPALYEPLAELLDYAAWFWNPKYKDSARDHFSPEALTKRMNRAIKYIRGPAGPLFGQDGSQNVTTP